MKCVIPGCRVSIADASRRDARSTFVTPAELHAEANGALFE
jgi:hypothetical protein